MNLMAQEVHISLVILVGFYLSIYLDSHTFFWETHDSYGISKQLMYQLGSPDEISHKLHISYVTEAYIGTMKVSQHTG